ncbi:hypothetical protein ACWD6P_14025 [Streptomyces sp. NPDC002446]
MPDLADYFDRLLARHAPATPRDPFAGVPGGRTDGAGGHGDGAGAGGARRTLVRPRLPGPFERVEALGGGPAGPDEPAALYPQGPRTSPSGAGPEAQIRYEREIRTTTERHTTVLGNAAPREAFGLVEAEVRPAGPLLRPAAAPGPGPRGSASPDAVPARRRADARAGDGNPGPASPGPVRPGGDLAPAAAAGALRPRAGDVPAAARPAARAAAAARRGQRGAERVVHVQIGRLEVSAAGTERPAAEGRPARAQRRAPSLSLADYLARGERTS